MAYYRLYFKVGGQIKDVAEVIVDDDKAALDQATAAFDGRAMELWELGRMVASWEAQPAPASESTMRSGVIA